MHQVGEQRPDYFSREGFSLSTGIYVPGGEGEPARFHTVAEVLDPDDKMDPDYQQVVEDIVSEGMLPEERPPGYEIDFDTSWRFFDEEVVACMSRADIAAFTNDEHTVTGVYPARVEASAMDGTSLVVIGSSRHSTTAEGSSIHQEGYGGDWAPDQVDGQTVNTSIEVEVTDPRDIYGQQAAHALSHNGWQVVAGENAMDQIAAGSPDGPRTQPTILVKRADGAIPDRDRPTTDLDHIWQAHNSAPGNADPSPGEDQHQQVALGQIQQQQSPTQAGPGLG